MMKSIRPNKATSFVLMLDAWCSIIVQEMAGAIGSNWRQLYTHRLYQLQGALRWWRVVRTTRTRRRETDVLFAPALSLIPFVAFSTGINKLNFSGQPKGWGERKQPTWRIDQEREKKKQTVGSFSLCLALSNHPVASFRSPQSEG